MAKPKQASGRPLVRPPTEARQLLGQALRFMQGGLDGQAKAACLQLLQLEPQHPQAHYILGMLAARAGEYGEAARALSLSLRFGPDHPAAYNNLGVTLRRLQRHQEAAESFGKAVALKPDYVEAHFNLGNTLRDMGRGTDALASYQRALALHPQFTQAHDAVARVLLELGQVEPALAAAEASLRIRPDNAEAHLQRGNALARLKRQPEALASFERVLALQPDHADAHTNRAGLLLEANRAEEALAGYQRALALVPTHLDALEGHAMAATRARRFDEALASYRRLYDLAPEHPNAAGSLLHAQMLCCDWSGYYALREVIARGLASGAQVAEPFGYQGVAESEAQLLACARIYAEAEFPPGKPVLTSARAVAADGRITIGYLCGEFRQHATTILMCGVYERHDRERIRLLAFDNGGSDGSALRQRVEAAFDEVVDIRGLGDRAAAELIRRRGVDILVNLNGYYGEGRMGVFALRPAPIQVNYLGFPGTLGAPYIDYLVADEVVIPAASRDCYREQVAWLPGCYQANDDRRPIADRGFTRAEAGLPGHAFVFCCFNNTYKITPGTFDSWMRILQRVDGSVLWLLHDNAPAAANLVREAQARGIAGERLVFAQRLPPAEHLARHRLADLFLDTLPYNAHTTASDALWAGLPVLTQRGTTFPGRVGASLLQAVGLPELIAESTAAYETLAVELARDSARLAALRARLQAEPAGKPLFDSAAFTRRLESLYGAMLERQRAGLPAGHLPAGG
jgi:predicted O-linked N-acetylglucosamine transferase (SPINDLY family)